MVSLEMKGPLIHLSWFIKNVDITQLNIAMEFNQKFARFFMLL
jgi:hypothetical protein